MLCKFPQLSLGDVHILAFYRLTLFISRKKAWAENLLLNVTDTMTII